MADKYQPTDERFEGPDRTTSPVRVIRVREEGTEDLKMTKGEES